MVTLEKEDLRSMKTKSAANPLKRGYFYAFFCLILLTKNPRKF